MTKSTPFREGLTRLSVAHFLVALVLLLLALPFVDQLAYGKQLEAVLTTVVLLSAVTAVGGRRRTLVVAALLVTPAVASIWIDHFWPSLIPPEFIISTAIVFVVFVIFHLLRFILLAPQVTSQVLCAGIATYLLLGLVWAYAYTLADRLSPGSFLFTLAQDAHRQMAGFESLYFSFSTLTGAGSGEIVAVSNLARTLVICQATVSMFYVAVLIARLVALYPGSQPPQ